MLIVEPEELKKQFIAWQCRIRQYSVRKDEGRPSAGMRPNMTVKGQDAGNPIVLIVKTDSEQVTREFRFMVQKSQDPNDRYKNAIKLLSEYYYQIPTEFDEELTAVYSITSELANQIVQVEQCVLTFDQGNQKYSLNCSVRDIDEQDLKYQTTYWHNHLFNPAMPGRVKILGFRPDWESSTFSTGSQA